ncbi:hypothetical protein CEN45_02475 [Fischerella thermalis CCMEE 5198]|uniref:WD40 repeat domain-containing protein n=1 Tax=Fischerella thermalis TaxID=372787 RepID=UPI000C80BD7F|nr:hypothetical protein CI594_07990 [Fischerella thermalis CCMEE 5196]PMB26968.1 hypothetical protein CEN45_02475 [Fischerella thermalis CCMEE 5198]
MSVLRGHFDLINTLGFSRDGQTLVSGSRDRTIKIWHVGTGKLQRTLPENAGLIYSIAISSDGNLLVSGSSDKS